VFSVLRRVGRHVGLSAALAALLVGCGGGTSQIQAFKPSRLIIFGDENSVLVDDGFHNGKKYTVNGLNASSVRDCLLLPSWFQSLATNYSFVFAECNAASAKVQAFIRARIGAKVDDATLGIDAQLAAQAAADSAVKSGDLVGVMLGANDVIDLSDRVQAGTMTSDQAIAEAQARGTRLADRVNTILATGARAIVITIPDMGLSPYALAQDALKPGAAARMSKLSSEFNARLRTSVDATRFDGRNYGLVLGDDIVQAMVRFPTSYSLNNVVAAVCAIALPDCTSASTDLVTADPVATGTNYLWADDRHISPQAHTYIGTQAVSRAQNNPF
jgi:phospholipase/lecithinase/hemolysin